MAKLFLIILGAIQVKLVNKILARIKKNKDIKVNITSKGGNSRGNN